MSHKAHYDSETTFLRQTGSFGRKHWMAMVISSVMGTITGSVMPMLEQWHSDHQSEKRLEAIEQRQNIDEQRLARQEQREEDERDSHTKPNHIKP